MKQLFLLFLLILGSTSLFSQQEYSDSFGKVSKAELEMKQYPQDKNAEAVVLFDVRKSKFIIVDNRWHILYERTTRIKILTDAGISAGNIEIRYNIGRKSSEHVSKIDAVTYNLEDGQIKKTELNANNIYDGRDGRYTLVKKFAMPNVRKGSVIEFKYQILSPFTFKLKSWNFQWRIPVRYSEDIVRINPYFEYAWKLQGAKNFTYHTRYVDQTMQHYEGISYQNMIYDMVMKNVPAFHNEAYISSVNDYILRVEFQLSKYKSPQGITQKMFNTWPDLITSLLKDDQFGKFINKSEKLASKVMDMASLEQKPEKVRFDSIMNFVKSNFTWDEYNDYWASEKPAEFLKDKSGNSASINLFTLGLLRKAGITAYPVLISTRDNGTIKYNYPYLDLFNYVVIVAQVDGKLILCDATEKYAQNDKLPPRCINHKGLIVMKQGDVKWISLANTFPSDIYKENNITYSNDQLTYQVSTLAKDNFALLYRNKFADQDQDKLLKALESDNYTLIDSTVQIINKKTKNKPFILKYSFETNPVKINGKLFISPFYNEVLSDNPFKLDQRYFPIDMVYPEKRSFKSTISIPKGYEIDYIPNPLSITNDLFSFNYSILENQGQLTVQLNYYFKKGIYPATDYIRLKSYFDDIVTKGNDRIVLKKKTSSDSK